MLLPCSDPMSYMGYLIIVTVSKKVVLEFSVFELMRLKPAWEPCREFGPDSTLRSLWICCFQVGGTGEGGGFNHFFWGGFTPLRGRGVNVHQPRPIGRKQRSQGIGHKQERASSLMALVVGGQKAE